MKPRIAIAAMVLPSLMGCGGGEYLQTQAEAHRQTAAAIESFAGREAKPRLAIDFHEDGRIKSIAMYDAQPLPRVPEFKPAPHPGWGFASAAAAALLPAIGSSLTIWAAGEAFEEVVKHTSGASNVATTSTAETTTVNTNEISDSRDMSVRTQDNDSMSTVVRESNVGGRDAGNSSISTVEETTTNNEETTSVSETTTENDSVDLDYTFRPNPILFPDEGDE